MLIITMFRSLWLLKYLRFRLNLVRFFLFFFDFLFCFFVMVLFVFSRLSIYLLFLFIILFSLKTWFNDKVSVLFKFSSV